MIVYLAGAIQAFVMYCVNGTSRSSLLIESVSTDSMIRISYVTSVRYAPEGRVIYSGNVPNHGRDISNLCRMNPLLW